MEAMTPFRSDTILVVVANPVDLLTSLCLQLSGLPPSRVLGSGTFLDTLRIRGILADDYAVCYPTTTSWTPGVLIVDLITLLICDTRFPST